MSNNIQKNVISSWSASILNHHLMYSIFENEMSHLNYVNWPSIHDYNSICSLRENIVNKNHQRIKFVSQVEINHFEDEYEPRIYLKGEVQTREKNWHDFFNFLIWITFPLTKAHINYEQYFLLKDRLGIKRQRTSYENALTLFDENGLIVTSSSAKLLELIKNAKWKELFWQHRQEIKAMKFFVFGHSLHEKALNPYIGMTAHSILLLEPPEFFNLNLTNQLNVLDKKIARIFEKKSLISPQQFHPIPILGIPGWHSRTEEEAFYKNTNYFRSK